jgi:excisionase family DNA binding protein
MKKLEYIKQREVADMLGVHEDTVDNWVTSGKLQQFRSPTGRKLYKLSEVEALITKD